MKDKKVLIDWGRYPEGIDYAQRCISMAKEAGALQSIKYANSHLSDAYEKMGNYKLALHYKNEFLFIKDSILKLEKNKLITDMDAKYQSEKKQKQIERQNSELIIKKAEIKQQSILRNAFVIGFMLMLILAVVIYRSYIQKKKSNILLAEQKHEIEEKNDELNQQNEEIRTQRDEIELQKHIIEEKNQEVMDSIHYARRIQRAILPNEDILKQNVTDYFILYKPKDIVSGDFYWYAKRGDHLLLTVADCTGHGVPGAFMSMLGMSFLNEIVARKDITKSSQVLDELRDMVIRSLQQRGIEGEQKDGMDIAFIALNTKTLELQFAGANNPLYIVKTRHDASLQPVLDEIRPDKMPVAIHTEMMRFTNHEIQLQKGDILFLYSDGYEDQFGGPNGKKFYSKKLNQLLSDNSNKPMDQQKDVLDTTFETWKGDYEQVDDVLIAGIKI
ncbi:MAG: SpoIIE family protein phosphatase [Bacteroidia bacterium]|nr:SpoIIE family protein phosphatase [Bacteroidia bacterium]